MHSTSGLDTTTRRNDLSGSRIRPGATLAVAALVAAACGAPSESSVRDASTAGPTVSGRVPAAGTIVPIATPRPTVPAPVMRAYEFPGGMIDGRAGGGKLYTRVEALVAIPQTPGRHPVAVVVHGSYPSCIDVTQDQLITSAALTRIRE